MFYEIHESLHRDGIHAYIGGLHTATCHLTPGTNEGWYQVKTSRRSNGSIRYRGFPSYNQALDYAMGYVDRISKSKAERHAQALARIDAVPLADLGLVSDGDITL